MKGQNITDIKENSPPQQECEVRASLSVDGGSEDRHCMSSYTQCCPSSVLMSLHFDDNSSLLFMLYSYLVGCPTSDLFGK